MIVKLLLMVLIDLPIIKFTCQHHVSGYVCCVWHLGWVFFSPIDWNNLYSKTTDHCTLFFVLKHEKQELSYNHIKFEGDKSNSFFLQFILWEHPFFCPNTENYLGLRGWCPCNYLVWIRLHLTQTVVWECSTSIASTPYHILCWSAEKKHSRKWSQEVLLCTNLVTPTQGQGQWKSPMSSPALKVFTAQDSWLNGRTNTTHYIDPYVIHKDQNWAQKFLLSHITTALSEGQGYSHWYLMKLISKCLNTFQRYPLFSF